MDTPVPTPMTTPHVVLRVIVTGRMPSSTAEQRLSTLLIVSEQEYRAGCHLDEALHRASLLGIADARVAEVRQVASTFRTARPLPPRRSRPPR